MGTLANTVTLSAEKLYRHPNETTAPKRALSSQDAVLIVLAAGKGTRFGTQPKCIQPVLGVPLAKHSLEAFSAAIAPSTLSADPSPLTSRPSPLATTSICLIGYRHEEVAAALGPGPRYVISANPAGGTAQAVYEAFCVPELLAADPLVIITMGDRVVPSATFRRLLTTHAGDGAEAALTFLTARYEPPKHLGKGRVLRDPQGHVLRIVEEKDIASEPDAVARLALHALTEGNCPLYAIRARTLHALLGPLTNANAQVQFYLTDIIAALAAQGHPIRTITTQPGDFDYDLLCADVTRPADLAILESVLARQQPASSAVDEVARAVAVLSAGRPQAQIASIARQLREILTTAQQEKLGLEPHRPIAIGVSGGRLRIAFMHPDMTRFFGPAWQMPIGAGSPEGSEQIVVLAQATDDRRIHLYPLDAKFRESINHIPADDAVMFPDQQVSDWHSYEGFGTRMSEALLLSLGYFTDEEIEARRQRGLPLPPSSLRVSSNLRRPFALVGNALASFRTLREGSLGARVQQALDRHHFNGLRLICTGNIPQGGFSSSSALTVATKNAINHLFDLHVPPDVLVHLACQAEYGTGVRAGSLDQATEQKGVAHQGTLISSNPADNYRILGTYPVPTERFKMIFPYSVPRDREAWRWSWGLYAETAASPETSPTTVNVGEAGSPSEASAAEGSTLSSFPPSYTLTATEWRKLTGKAAEIAAILVQLPLDVDFFKVIEADLVEDGALSLENRRWIAKILRQVPLAINREELRAQVASHRDWYTAELIRVHQLDAATAAAKTEATFNALFTGWRNPRLPRPQYPLAPRPSPLARTSGVPLRAMLAYLFSEVAKNFHLIHHPDEWIACVTRSQQGDRAVAIDPERLPEGKALPGRFEWEAGLKGTELLEAWLERCGAQPYNFNAGLDDASLRAAVPPEFHRWPGGSFFRGLALIDLAEAMLKRAFGQDTVAVRVNAAGQGDFFQVHVDRQRLNIAEVKGFLRDSFYTRFGLNPDSDFVDTYPGGGAVGVTLTTCSSLERVVAALASDSACSSEPVESSGTRHPAALQKRSSSAKAPEKRELEYQWPQLELPQPYESQKV